MNFFKTKTEWKHCMGLCTDGAAAMTGRHSGVTTRFNKIAHSDLVSTHCFIHCQ